MSEFQIKSFWPRGSFCLKKTPKNKNTKINPSVFLKIKIIKAHSKSRLSIKELARRAQFGGESFTGAAAAWGRKFLSGGYLPVNLTRLEHFNQPGLFPMATSAGRPIWRRSRCDTAPPQKHPAGQKVHGPLVVFIRFYSIWGRKTTNVPQMSRLPLLCVKSPIDAKKSVNHKDKNKHARGSGKKRTVT